VHAEFTELAPQVGREQVVVIDRGGASMVSPSAN
jgi:hypothetical protein